MIKFKNTLEYNNLRKNILDGKITSIWRDNRFFKGARSFPILNFNYLTSDFSDFEKNIFSKEQKMIYHLSGYGVNYDEALVSYIGESSERYTFASLYSVIKDKVISASYLEMVEKYGGNNVCDLKYINSYFKKEDDKYYVNETDKIKWVPMNSLINLGEKVYIPLQFVVSNNGGIYEDEKPFMTSAVSTGTASHETVLKALENAVIEYLQIDSFNLWWYGGVEGKKLDVNVKSFLKKYFKNDLAVNQFLKYFEIEFTDISYDKDIDIIVCEAFARQDNLPKYTVGVQGAKTMEKALYRGLMECIAVMEYNMNIPWMNYEKYKSIQKNKIEINNLDDNVIMYSKYGKPRQVKHDYKYYKNLDCERKCNFIHNLKKISKYAGFLNITLPEFQRLNLEVVRVVIPELLSLCLPSYPPYYHQRYEEIGGIRNNVPHPLA